MLHNYVSIGTADRFEINRDDGAERSENTA